MIVAIVGNRKGWGRLTIYKKLDSLNLSHNDTIVTGGADGVDTYAMDYAKEKGINLMVFYPDIFKLIPERFYKRNEEIVLYSDRVIAFNKKIVSGTRNTINWCNHYNTPVEIITSDCNTCKSCINSAEFNHCYFNSDCKNKDEFCRRHCRFVFNFIGQRGR